MAHIGFKSRERRSGSRATGLLIALLALSSSYVAMGQTNEPTEEKPSAVSTSFEELQLFADTFDAIRRGHVEDVTDAELFEMAVKGMLTSLDPHSAYLTDDD
jgi:carboxyl-terminal processing protease